MLLAIILQGLGHEPIQKTFQDKIFTPLAMHETVWPTGGDMPSPFANGITMQTGSGKQEDATHWNPSWGFTAGQLVSDLDDLHTWVDSYTTGTLISAAMQKQRLTWVTIPPNTPEKHYGLGINENHGWLGHTGELPGYNRTGYYLPSKNATIVVMVNSDIALGAANPAVGLVSAITRILTPQNVPV